jgi:hypothetical protein
MLKLLRAPSPEHRLSAQLRTAGDQLAAKFEAGILDCVDVGECVELHALRIFLDSAADLAETLEDIAADRLPRERRMTPVGDLVRRIVERASK